ncbi:hypothetical protein [Spiroplasma endosymbiont of Aspidapion aeneum]|uniref:hypothetical protein n=1 Tax=Spiroplasma endosymbiont of Aspidapion aeneum TaxID=3066276 RepID=UPI00313C2F85
MNNMQVLEVDIQDFIDEGSGDTSFFKNCNFSGFEEYTWNFIPARPNYTWTWTYTDRNNKKIEVHDFQQHGYGAGEREMHFKMTFNYEK